MTIPEIMKNRMCFSFEVFPPKEGQPLEPLLDTCLLYTSPEDCGVHGLVSKMRLSSHDNAHKPAGILKGH